MANNVEEPSETACGDGQSSKSDETNQADILTKVLPTGDEEKELKSSNGPTLACDTEDNYSEVELSEIEDKTASPIPTGDVGIKIEAQRPATESVAPEVGIKLELPADESSKGDRVPFEPPAFAARPEPLAASVFGNNLNGIKKVSIREFEEPEIRKKTGAIRHIVALLALSSIVLANMNRQAFNQALVSMTRHQPHTVIDNFNITTEKYLNFEKSIETTPYSMTTSNPQDTTQMQEGEFLETELSRHPVEDDDDKFDWTAAQIGTLQAAFSYGYTPFMIPGGRMSELYGAKWVVFISGFGSALCCILSPLLADTNYWLLVTSRVMMGLCQTGVSPALYALLTRWMPPDESSVYLPMIKVAVMLGFMSGSLVSGFFTWRLTFYAVGTISLIWSALWAVLVSSDPNQHGLIGDKELDYIRWEIKEMNKGRKQSINSSRKASAPWLRILLNPVIIAFMLAKFTNKLSTDAQTMQIPMYLKNVFHVRKELNGILSAANFAIQGIFTGLIAWMAREFVVRKIFGLNKTGVRRLFQGLCNFGMGLAYILITFNMGSLNVVCAAVIMISLSAMFGAGGEAVLPIDLSTDFSASIMAIANSCANFSGIVLPIVVSFILEGKLGSAEHWNIVWWVVGGSMIMGGLIFVCKVKAKIQDFSSRPDERKGNDKEESEEESDKPKSVRIEMKEVRSQGTNHNDKVIKVT